MSEPTITTTPPQNPEPSLGITPPPPPGANVSVEDVLKLSHKQYQENATLLAKHMDLEKRIASISAEHEGKLKENADKVAAHDTISQRLTAYETRAKNELKSTLEKLPKEFTELKKYKVEDLEKDPLGALSKIETELTEYNAMLEIAKNKLKEVQDDGTNSDPGHSNPQGAAKYETLEEMRRARYEARKNKGT